MGLFILKWLNKIRFNNYRLPSYVRFRQLCGLSTATTFDQVLRFTKFPKIKWGQV